MQLKLENISCAYDNGAIKHTVLRDINLEINKGEFVAIIGHTGSGKSTLIQTMNALIKPSAGRVLFEGEDINGEDYNRKALRGKVGLVFQYPDHQLFEVSIYKDVAFGPTNQGLPKEEIDKRVREALDLVGIKEEDYENPPLELSGGQKKRITIAGVLAMKPEVLILDEPTAGLDPEGSEFILGKIKEIRDKTGITVILVSHSMEDVAKYAERIVVIDNGTLVSDGLPAHVFKNADDLEKRGLSIPQITGLMHKLKEGGMDISTDCITVEEAYSEIKKYLSK